MLKVASDYSPIPDSDMDMAQWCRYEGTYFCAEICTRWKGLPEACAMHCHQCGFARTCLCGSKNLPFEHLISINEYGQYDPKTKARWWTIFKPITPRRIIKMPESQKRILSLDGIIDSTTQAFLDRHGHQPDKVFHVDRLYVLVAGPVEGPKCVNVISAVKKSTKKKAGVKWFMIKTG